MKRIQAMSRMTTVAAAAGLVWSTAVLMAQGTQPVRSASSPAQGSSASATVLAPPMGIVPITDRLPAKTLEGTVVEVSCFRSLGAASVASAGQIACAKDAFDKKIGMIGLLSEGDGLFKLVGNLTANNYAKLVQYLGQKVAIAGSEVIISNNYDYHAFDAQKITPAKK